MENATTWLGIIDKYGLPIVALVVLFSLMVIAIRALWSFLKPLVNRLFDAALTLIDKQSQFIDSVSTHQTELKALVESGQDGHDRTHQILDRMEQQQLKDSKMISELHGRRRA